MGNLRVKRKPNPWFASDAYPCWWIAFAVCTLAILVDVIRGKR